MNKTESHLLSNKWYDVLKMFALVIFPAVGTLYFTIAGIWGLPAAQEVLSTIVAIDLFLGSLIKLGDVSYNNSEARFDGQMVVDTKHSGGKMYNLELNDEPGALENKKEVIFKVKPEAG